MSWLDAGDDDEEDDDDYQLPEEVSEYWRRGPTTAPRRVFKIGGLAPPLQAGLVSELGPGTGFQPSSRHKTRSSRDNDKKVHRQEEVYEGERLRNSKKKQECTSRSPKHRSLPTSLFEELSKDQFPFDWSKKNNMGLGSKVLYSDMKRSERDVGVPTKAQTNGIQGCKVKNVQQLHKASTCGAAEAHIFSSKAHNELCYSMSFPSNEKIQNYHNPLHGASAAFIHRLTEIAGLECDTIRQEKIRKLKKRLDC